MFRTLAVRPSGKTVAALTEPFYRMLGMLKLARFSAKRGVPSAPEPPSLMTTRPFSSSVTASPAEGQHVIRE
jgi:hypothetical protein